MAQVVQLPPEERMQVVKRILDSLMRHADMTMYRAKKSGKNRYHFYNPDSVD